MTKRSNWIYICKSVLLVLIVNLYLSNLLWTKWTEWRRRKKTELNKVWRRGSRIGRINSNVKLVLFLRKCPTILFNISFDSPVCPTFFSVSYFFVHIYTFLSAVLVFPLFWSPVCFCVPFPLFSLLFYSLNWWVELSFCVTFFSFFFHVQTNTISSCVAIFSY